MKVNKLNFKIVLFSYFFVKLIQYVIKSITYIMLINIIHCNCRSFLRFECKRLASWIYSGMLLLTIELGLVLIKGVFSNDIVETFWSNINKCMWMFCVTYILNSVKYFQLGKLLIQFLNHFTETENLSDSHWPLMIRSNFFRELKKLFFRV